MDVKLLIIEIEKHPVLLDVSDELFKDRNKKNKRWIKLQLLYLKILMKKLEQNNKLLVSTDHVNLFSNAIIN